VIFLINTFYFSPDLVENPEEQYIEETLESSKERIDYIKIAKNILNQKEKEKRIIEKKIKIREEKIKSILEKNKYRNIEFSAVPYEFLDLQKKEKEEIETILKNRDIFSLLKKIEITFYEEK
jgi:hypothetical protein